MAETLYVAWIINLIIFIKRLESMWFGYIFVY